MPSQARASREAERRLSVRTLAIASASSAVAAIVTSRLWAAGTPIAAAMTPVIVTLVSELLNRPAEKIADRLTSETDALPEAAGAAAPPPAPREHRRPSAGAEGVRVYRSARRAPPWRLVAATAALAFVIGIAVLSVPQLVAGESLLKGSPPLYDSAVKPDKPDRDQEPVQTPAPTEEEPAAAAPAETAPEQTDTEPAPTTTTTAPEQPPPGGQAPEQTTTTPAAPELQP